MALKKRYYTVSGEIIAERVAGGQRINYATDALGSVVGTISGQVLQNTYIFKPYGDLGAKTGTSADPLFGWVGAYGYRTTTSPPGQIYVRARHFRPGEARWTSTDTKWPDQPPFAYTQPVTYVDPSGKQAEGIGGFQPMPAGGYLLAKEDCKHD